MLTFYNKYKGGDFSQNGESGIIDEICKRIKLNKGTAVEFGAPTKDYCSNIFHLPEPAWNKMYFDINPQDPTIMRAEITPENVNSIIPNCDILSIDVDGNDYNIWAAYKHKPAIVIIEINSSIHPEADYPVSSLSDGTGYKPMVGLGDKKGYMLICHTGNLIFVDQKYSDKFPEIDGAWEDFFNTQWLSK